jgi:hypothetical protein
MLVREGVEYPMSETAETAVVDSRDEARRLALRLLEHLRDEGMIVFTSELECLGWYNEARRHSFSRTDMSKWADAGWERVFRYRPRPDGRQEVLER